MLNKDIDSMNVDELKLLAKKFLDDTRFGLHWDRSRVEEDFIEMLGTGAIPVLREIDKKSFSTKICNGGDHLLIEGDNYHSLSLLQFTHKEMVDVIYIDPPYNTGNKDFRYNDNFINKEDQYRHSKWINFMEKRLELAYNLLKDDGVIFISIDDNEYAQLKLLCDRIFGEGNRIDRGVIIWNNAGSTKGFRNIVKNHEYILAYSKNSKLVKNYFGENFPDLLGEVSDRVYIKRSAKNPVRRLEFKKGTPIKGVLDVEFKGFVGGETTRLDIVEGELKFEGGKLIGDVTLEGSFSIPNQIEEYYTNIKEGKKTYDNQGQEFLSIFFNKNGLPQYVKRRNNKPMDSIIKDIPNSGSRDLEKVLGKDNGFSYPKPVSLIKHLLSYFSNKDAVILDFFAGSGSTGQSVLELNKEDGGNRKFILCTNNEINSDNKNKEAKQAQKRINEIISKIYDAVNKKDDKLYRDLLKEKEQLEEKYGVCSTVTYPRLKTVMTREDYNLGGNLKYFKCDFIPFKEDKVDMAYDLAMDGNMVDIVKVREDVFKEVLKTDGFEVYENDEKIVAIQSNNEYALTSNKVEETLRKSNKEDKKMYVFSENNNLNDVVVFYNTDGIELAVIPRNLIDILYNSYEKLVVNTNDKDDKNE